MPYCKYLTWTGNGATGTQAVAVGFQADWLIRTRGGLSGSGQANSLKQGSGQGSSWWGNHGHNQNTVTFGATDITLPSASDWNGSGGYTGFALKKAASFLDIVEWTGNGANGRMISHNLGAPPEMILARPMNYNDASWACLPPVTNAGLNGNYLHASSWWGATTGAMLAATSLWNVNPTDAAFMVQNTNGNYWNASGLQYLGFLMASKAGHSKLGTYVGDGQNQRATRVATDFLPRFVMVKATSHAGHDWRTFHRTGDVAGTTLVQDDWSDFAGAVANDANGMNMQADGFNPPLSQNVSGVTYMFWAVGDADPVVGGGSSGGGSPRSMIRRNPASLVKPGKITSIAESKRRGEKWWLP